MHVGYRSSTPPNQHVFLYKIGKQGHSSMTISLHTRD